MLSSALKARRVAQFLQPRWKPVWESVRRSSESDLKILLRIQPLPEITRLDCGLTVATECRDAQHGCVGLYIDAGSRYENFAENGIANFYQHMVFKGTMTRKKACLQKLMNCTGAQFGSFTTREHCAYFAQCLNLETACVIDLLLDCVFYSSLDACEIEYQKQIVYEEMLLHDNDANELLWDYLHGAAYQGTQLGQSVPGPSNNLHLYNYEILDSFVNKMIDPAQTVLAYVGPLSHCAIISMIQRPLCSRNPCREVDRYRFTGADFRFRDDTMPYANCAIGFEGPCMCDEESYILDVAAVYLGGWDNAQMGSKNNAHNLAQAGGTGMCEAYQGFNIKYKDCSLFGVQFIGDRMHLDDMLANIQSAFMRLCVTVTEPEIAKAKSELKTYILSSQESAVNRCHDLGRWVLYDKFCPSLYERISIVDKIRAGDVRDVCSQYLYDREPAVAAVGPCECLPDYNRIRAGQYWLRL